MTRLTRLTKPLTRVAYTAAIMLGLFIGARAVVLWSSQSGDLNFPGLSATSLGTYKKLTPATGFTYTFDNSQTRMLFKPSGTLAAGTAYLAVRPSDGSEACIFSTEIVSSLTLLANTGQTIADAITALSANVRYCYTYSLSNATWNRSQ